MSAAQSAPLQELRGVLIPTGSAPLLLPNAAMAEVIDYREVTARPKQAPRWVLGSVVWRRRPMPLISIERMMGGTFDPHQSRLRIAVCHGLRIDGSLPFIGIVSRGIPRLVRVSESVIGAERFPPLDPSVPILARVHLRGDTALIPDLDSISELLRQAL